MSGELQVVFIYDTKRCQREEDDPREAILYFHPEEIPESRRIAICGQLMGITHFLIDVFGAPKILTLENGKFALRDFGRQYVLALGCSSVTPDWLLEKQTDILYNLTRFFHKDIDNILRSVDGDRNLLSSKLASIMDHYLPISQHHGDLFALTFGILPILNLPKSASHISLSATVILQTCMLRTGVLGGIVMFQNKVVGVELIQDIAQKLAFIQPYQLPPADAAKAPFDLPPSVQLLTVYIQNKDLHKLRQHAATYQYPSRCDRRVSDPKEYNGASKTKIDSIREEEDGASSSLGFSETSTTSESTNAMPDELGGLENNLTYSSLGTASDDKESSFQTNRETSTLKDPLEVSWNGNLKEETLMRKFGPVAMPLTCVHTNGCESNFLHPPKSFRSLHSLHSPEEEKPLRKSLSSSLTDPFFPFIRCDGKNISKALLDLHIPTAPPERLESPTEADKAGRDDLMKNADKAETTKLPESKASPVRMHSKGEGKEGKKKDETKGLSHCEEAMEQNSQEKEKENMDGFKLNFKPSSGKGLSRPKDLALNTSSKTKSRRKWSTFEDMMSPLIENPPPLIEIGGNVPMTGRDKSGSAGGSEMDFMFRKPLSEVEDVGLGDPLIRTRMMSSFRKLSSPENFSSSHEGFATTATASSDLDLQRKGKKSGDNRAAVGKSSQVSRSPERKEIPESESCCPEEYEKALLFIYSLGGMRLLVLLEKEFLGDSELIHSLWDYGSSSMSELEVAVSNVEEQSMSMGHGHHDHYCYLHYEPVWKSLAHGGRNHSMDFDVVQHMHQDFQVYPNINELIIRGEDHVVYGYQCVGSEVFYQQSAGPQPGLPMPSDLMGKVPLKAKRRLERDHNILLL